MKFLFFPTLLVLSACDSSDEEPPKKPEPNSTIKITPSVVSENERILANIEDKIRNGDRQEVEQLLSGIVGLNLPENTVTLFMKRYREASDLRDSKILQGLGPNHPDIVALNQMIETSFSKAKEDFLRVIMILQSE